MVVEVIKMKIKTKFMILLLCFSLFCVMPAFAQETGVSISYESLPIDYVVNTEFTATFSVTNDGSNERELIVEREISPEETLIEYPLGVLKTKMQEYEIPYLEYSIILESGETKIFEIVSSYEQMPPINKLYLPVISVLDFQIGKLITVTESTQMNIFCNENDVCDSGFQENNRNCPQDCSENVADQLCDIRIIGDPDCLSEEERIAIKSRAFVISELTPDAIEKSSAIKMTLNEVQAANDNFIQSKVEELSQKAVLARADQSTSPAGIIDAEENGGYTGIATVGQFFKGEGASLIPFIVMVVLIISVCGWFVYKKYT